MPYAQKPTRTQTTVAAALSLVATIFFGFVLWVSASRFEPTEAGAAVGMTVLVLLFVLSSFMFARAVLTQPRALTRKERVVFSRVLFGLAVLGICASYFLDIEFQKRILILAPSLTGLALAARR